LSEDEYYQRTLELLEESYLEADAAEMSRVAPARAEGWNVGRESGAYWSAPSITMAAGSMLVAPTAS